jgi:ABC-type antimicrobial peptide transport system permease subunit
MALGADRARVTRMVLRSGAILVVAGIAIGTLAALALTRFLAGMLFAVTPRDPASFVLVAGALATAALLAGLLPARRAMRVDPASSLRGD